MKSYRIWLLYLLLLLCGLVSYWSYQNWQDHSQDVPLLAAARRYRVEPALVKAVAWRESRFNENARGGKGELGLMQILPAAAAKDWCDSEHRPQLSSAELLNPRTNTLIGAWYLGRLMKRYAQTDNPVPYVLADYNAGRSNVLKWKQGAATTNSTAFIQQINFPTTRAYVKSIMNRWEYYRPIFPPREGK